MLVDSSFKVQVLRPSSFSAVIGGGGDADASEHFNSNHSNGGRRLLSMEGYPQPNPTDATRRFNTIPDPVSTALTAHGHASSSNYGHYPRRSSFRDDVSQSNFQFTDLDHSWRFELPGVANTLPRSNSFVPEGIPQVDNATHTYPEVSGPPPLTRPRTEFLQEVSGPPYPRTDEVTGPPLRRTVFSGPSTNEVSDHHDHDPGPNGPGLAALLLFRRLAFGGTRLLPILPSRLRLLRVYPLPTIVLSPIRTHYSHQRTPGDEEVAATISMR
ncbi:hypothetical protein BC827DRAFT_1271952 [Russula dissimulans]|nr:hypothetical protein BC827DRAFT_1271952 [Russula dissimulans]